MKLATTTADFSAYAQTPAAALELCGKSPFRYIDLNLPHRYMGEDWERVTHDAGETAARLGMTLIQAHGGDFLSGGDSTPRIPELTRAIRACGRLGIPQIVIHAQWDASVPYPAGMEQFFTYNKGLYGLLFPVMEETGVKVLIENSCEANMGPACYFMTGWEMVGFLDFVGHPLLGAVWDTGHANCRGNRQYEDLTALRGVLDGVHIHDNDGRCDGHTAPFMGILDWDSVLRGLIDTDYKGYFTFECDNFPMRGGGWPYLRCNDQPETARLQNPSLELKLMAEDYLYETGKYLLSQYGAFEA
ncbi:MAG: sugar phosphate isomerase/epimerase [Clostridia bacterium]|nr:sugar phosphate isomerase/epimerase [Clostridia bacterium]